ncbi:hypothetical protein FRC06_007832, partial [Ceratobasidium sp. 370]
VQAVFLTSPTPAPVRDSNPTSERVPEPERVLAPAPVAAPVPAFASVPESAASSTPDTAWSLPFTLAPAPA